MEDKFTLGYDMDNRYRVVDLRYSPNVYETEDTYTQVEALTLMWALEAQPERADQGYIEWRRRAG